LEIGVNIVTSLPFFSVSNSLCCCVSGYRRFKGVSHFVLFLYFVVLTCSHVRFYFQEFEAKWGDADDEDEPQLWQDDWDDDDVNDDFTDQLRQQIEASKLTGTATA
jgi:hypothetical protein